MDDLLGCGLPVGRIGQVRIFRDFHDLGQRKDYLTRMNLTKSRVKFNISSKMLDIKFNYSAKYERDLWLCDSCCSSIETQSLLLFCPAYSTLREGKDLSNDDHLIGYIQNVMQIRTKLKLRN